MILVLDTSAAIGIVMGLPDHNVFRQAVEEADRVLSPQLLVPEAANVFWKYYRFKTMSLEDCERGLDRVIGLADELVDTTTLQREAFALACQQQRPAYDMFFLALARRQNAVLATADADLRECAAGLGIRAVQAKSMDA